MTEKMLITKLVRNDNRADLYGHGHRYRDMILFDLSDLADVGIDYAALQDGIETPCRFWAHYELGEKLNGAKNPYKDIVRLEPATPQAPTAATPTGSGQDILAHLATITGELRSLRLILLRLARPSPVPGNQAPATGSQDQESAPGGDLASELFAGAVAGDAADLEQFYDLVAAGLADGTLHQDDVDALLAENLGYDLAADCLRAEMTRRQATTAKQRNYRDAVISRLMELQKSPLVTSGAVAVDLEPGWQWTASTDDLIEAGKALKESLAA
jgi:hypothetical protein